MCGRYAVKGLKALLQEGMRIRGVPDLPDVFNASPRMGLPTVRQVEGDRVVEVRRWGLVPSWAKDLAAAPSPINARSETVLEKPMFRDPFRKGNRCLVPASGFYEWQTGPEGKVPFFIRPKEGWFLFAGLTASRPAPDGALESFCILTTEPNEVAARVHDRMPVILPEEAWSAWLDPKTSPEALLPLLRPAPAEAMEAYRVSAAVGNVRNQGPELLEPVEA